MLTISGFEDEHPDDLERERDHLDQRTVALEDQVNNLENTLTRLEKLAAAAMNKATANKVWVTELQPCELEKGAHLLEERLDEHTIDVTNGRL